MHDNTISYGNKKLKQSNIKYQCTAGHISFYIPITKMKKWCYQTQNSSNMSKSNSDSTISNIKKYFSNRHSFVIGP